MHMLSTHYNKPAFFATDPLAQEDHGPGRGRIATTSGNPSGRWLSIPQSRGARLPHRQLLLPVTEHEKQPSGLATNLERYQDILVPCCLFRGRDPRALAKEDHYGFHVQLLVAKDRHQDRAHTLVPITILQDSNIVHA